MRAELLRTAGLTILLLLTMTATFAWESEWRWIAIGGALFALGMMLKRRR